MKRIALIYGGASGSIIISSVILGIVMADSRHLAAQEWLGYLIMLVALSVIFAGVKKYRDEELGGVIRFGTAMAVGLGIAAVASVIYVVAWEAYLAITDHSYMESYIASVIQMREAEGMTGAALQAEIASLESMKERYSNLLFRIPVTFSEIFPVGLVVALVSAGLLKNPNVLPAKGQGAVQESPTGA